MTVLLPYLHAFKNFIWSLPLLIFIIGSGVFLTIRLRGLQFRYLGYAFRQAFTSHDEKAEGDISHFQSLMTFLAGAIGTGSITGVATGVAVGGVGSLFWMWLTALIGMIIRYAEALLSIKYREVDKRGEMVGGPMEYIGRGLQWRWMAVLFAALGAVAAFGIGNLVQANAIGDAATVAWELDPWVTGCVIAASTGLVIVGGVRSIGTVAGILVPVMAIFYLGGGLVILVIHYKVVPAAIAKIVSSAFTGQGAVGGFAGSTMIMAMQMGVSRSIFSSEAGLGISAIAAAAAKTDYPGRQAMVAMTGVLLSTVVICSLTGLILAVMDVVGAVGPNGKPIVGTAMTVEAFRRGIPGGGVIVTVGLVLFAYSTIVAWAYYGEKCCEYLLGEKSIILYRVIFTVLLIPGAALDLELVWAIADIFNGLMCIPNLIAVVALSGVVVAETKTFLKVADKEIASR